MHALLPARHLLLGLLLTPSIDDLIHQAKLDSLFGSHVIVPLERLLEALSRGRCFLIWILAVVDVDLGQLGAYSQNLFGVQGDIARLALSASARF